MAISQEQIKNLAYLFSRSKMKEEEKELWLQALKLMNEEQWGKLISILQNEVDELDKIEQQYQQDLAGIISSQVQNTKEVNQNE